MHARPVRSFKPQDDAQDVPEPVRDKPSAHNCTAEEVGKIQKICEQENGTLCQQINLVADQVSALAQQQQAANGNQGIILDVIRTELDEKIDKLPEVQPGINTLVEELFTLRYDIKTLPESQ